MKFIKDLFTGKFGANLIDPDHRYKEYWKVLPESYREIARDKIKNKGYDWKVAVTAAHWDYELDTTPKDDRIPEWMK